MALTPSSKTTSAKSASVDDGALKGRLLRRPHKFRTRDLSIRRCTHPKTGDVFVYALLPKAAARDGWGDWLSKEFKKHSFKVAPFNPSNVVGMVVFRKSHANQYGKSIYRGDHLTVDSRYRRRGIATLMYRFAAKQLSLDIRPDKHQTRDGQAFWKTLKIS